MLEPARRCVHASSRTLDTRVTRVAKDNFGGVLGYKMVPVNAAGVRGFWMYKLVIGQGDTVPRQALLVFFPMCYVFLDRRSCCAFLLLNRAPFAVEGACGVSRRVG